MIQNRIDAYTHILPNRYREVQYKEALRDLGLDSLGGFKTHHDQILGLFDIEGRLCIMEELDGLKQVLTMVDPPLKLVASPENAVEVAKLANDELAGLIAQVSRAVHRCCGLFAHEQH